MEAGVTVDRGFWRPRRLEKYTNLRVAPADLTPNVSANSAVQYSPAVERSH